MSRACPPPLAAGRWPRPPSRPRGTRRAWLALAMSSTLAGNLTVMGSVANLIVVERARRLTRQPALAFAGKQRNAHPLRFLVQPKCAGNRCRLRGFDPCVENWFVIGEICAPFFLIIREGRLVDIENQGQLFLRVVMRGATNAP